MNPSHGGIDDILPVSPTQAGMLLQSVASPRHDPYVVQARVPLRGSVDPDALQAACRQLVRKHAALRASFHWQEVETPVQVIRREVELPLTQADWAGRRDQDAHLRAYLAADRARGFDLTAAPLMRIHLVRLADRSYLFIWTFHHAIVDGWSLAILLSELGRCYDALTSGREIPAAPEPPSYREYVSWLQARDAAAAEAYWRRTLRDVSPSAWPGRAAAGGRPSAGGTRSCALVWTADASARVQAFAQQQRVTLSTVLHGAWAVLLSRYASHADVVFGTVTSGRPAALAGIDRTVGLFVNTLPLRVRVPPHLPVGRWLQDLQRLLVEMREHEFSPSRAAHQCGVPGLPFDTILAFENYPVDGAAPGPVGVGSSIRMDNAHVSQPAPYPLALTASYQRRLHVRLLYDTGRFERTEVELIAAHLQVLLDQMVRDAARPLGSLAMVTPAARQRALADSTGSAVPLPRAAVHHLVAEQAARTPDAVAVESSTERLSYGELRRRADQLAQHLQGLGVGPESRVAVCLPPSADLVVALLGALTAGGAYVPLDPDWPEERLAFVLADTGAAAVVTLASLRSRLPRLPIPVACLDAERAALRALPREPVRSFSVPDSLAYVVYTSGSTGAPKGTSISHRAVVRLVWQQAYAPLDASDRVAFASPVFFDAATFEIWSTLAAGATVVVVGADVVRSPRDLVAELERRGATTLFLTTVLFNQVAAHASSGFARLRRVLFGGEAVDPDAVRRVMQAGPPGHLIHVYGPTETTTFATAHVVDAAPAEGDTVPIGVPLRNTTAVVVDTAGQPAPTGVTGELHVGGPGVARGYLNRPALTADRFTPDALGPDPGARVYRTGDLVRRRADGSLVFVGRIDAQVKIRGFRVEPAEIEAVLGSHPDVRDRVVAVREDTPGEKKLVAYVVPRREAPTTTALRAYLQQRLPAYMVPAVFVPLETLPLTPTGKVDRRALPAPAGERPALAHAFVAPRTSIERTLAEIWQSALSVPQVGVTDNFFDLGGDSILAIQIVARATEAGLRVVPRDLFRDQTIADLAPHVTAVPMAGDVPPVAGPTPLTPIQRWFFAQDLAEPHHFNQAQWLVASAPVDAACLARSVEALIAHHDALRLRFRRGADGWSQELASDVERVPVARFEVAAVSPPKQTAALVEQAAALQGGLNLSAGPLVRVALCDREPGRVWLLVVIHHLVVDRVSWDILLSDLNTAYGQIAGGAPPALPQRTTRFSDWARRLGAYATSPALAAEAPYWRGVEEAPVASIPVDFHGGDNTMSSARSVSVSLTAGETRQLLREVPPAYRTHIDEVLLTALAQALAWWTGSPRVRVALEGHGRESLFGDVDLSRTVGWFTTMFPAVLDVTGATGPGEALKAVKEQRRRVPTGGLGYGVLRYLASGGSAETGGPDVIFNYLGQLASPRLARPFETIPAPVGPERSPRQRRHALIEIDAAIRGGRFVATWTYSVNRHAPQTIDRVAARFAAALRDLIAHCASASAGGYTPSDFGDVALTQSELDFILEGH